MTRFLLRTFFGALAFWVTTLLIPGITVTPFAHGDIQRSATFVLIAIVFGVLSGIIGAISAVIAFPLYFLMRPVLNVLVTALTFFLATQLSEKVGFGLFFNSPQSLLISAIVFRLTLWIISRLAGLVTAGYTNR